MLLSTHHARTRYAVIRVVASSLASQLEQLRRGQYVNLSPVLAGVEVDEIDAVVDHLQNNRVRSFPAFDRRRFQVPHTFSHTRLRRALCA